METGNVRSCKTWLQLIDVIDDLFPGIIVTGHGYSIEGTSEIKKEKEGNRNIPKHAITFYSAQKL